MMKTKIHLLSFLLICFASTAFSQESQLILQEEINRWKSDSCFEHAGIGIYLKEAGSGEVLAKTYPQLSLVPGSTLKLITTATALEMLGPNFRFETKLAYSGEIRNDSLYGNLYVVGGGDPALGSAYFKQHYLSNHFLDEWIRQIKQLGIKHISGDLVTDATIFEEQMIPDTWIWEDIGNYYGAGACGISVYDNSYKIHLTSPKQAGQKTRVKYTVPFVPELTFENHVKSSDINRDQAYVYGAPMDNKRTIRGTIPKEKTDFVIKGSIPNPPYQLAWELMNKIEEAKITIDGIIRARKENQEIPGLNLITKTVSPKLADIVRVTNHESVNLYAEHLLKYMAYLTNGQGTTRQGIEIVKDFWEKRGIKMNGLFMADGSGLSHFNLLTAKLMVELLDEMKNSKASKDFFNSIPYVPNGTLYFFNPLNFPGKSLRAKSGSMTRVRCYAGELKNKSGQTVLFAVFLNNFSCSQQKAIQMVEDLLMKISNY